MVADEKSRHMVPFEFRAMGEFQMTHIESLILQIFFIGLKSDLPQDENGF
jgi:hypothetical protein